MEGRSERRDKDILSILDRPRGLGEAAKALPNPGFGRAILFGMCAVRGCFGD